METTTKQRTPDTNQNIKSLAERMKICVLNQNFFSSQRLHKEETAEENKRHSTDNEAKVIVCITKHEALQSAAAIKSRIYQNHKRLTLPSPVDGMRIVPMGREFEHSATISQLIAEFDIQVSKFIHDYDNVLENAKLKLKTLFDSTLFPPKDILKTKFGNTIRYMPCPTGGAWDDFLSETLEVSSLELRSRITKAARHLVTRIKEYDIKDGAKLYESVLDNLTDICDLSGDFNLRDDPIITQVSKGLREISTDYSVETLRDNQPLRKEIINRTNTILGMLDFRNK